MSEQKVIWEGPFAGEATRISVVDEGAHLSIQIEALSEGYLHDIISKATTFAKAHPFVTGMMAGWAWDSIKQYNNAKKKSVYFHADDLSDRVKTSKLVDDLMRKSGYKIIKQGYKGGAGYEWELQPK